MTAHTIPPRSKWHFQPPGIDLLVYGFLFILIFLILPFQDSDFFWHMKTGEIIASTRSLPATDIFSYTKENDPWVLHEWLSQLIFYWVHAFSGYTGLRMLTALMFTLSFYIINRVSYSLNNNLFHTTMMTGSLFVITLTNCSPRPQLFTFLFLSIFVYVLFRLKYMGEKRKLILLPLIMVAWANTHGGYLIGLVLIGIIWLTELVSCFFINSEEKSCSRILPVLSVAFVATLMASLLTPYSYELWIYPFEVMGMDVTDTFISEWQSPNFHNIIYQAYLVAIMTFGATLIYSIRKPDLTELVLSGSFLFLGFIAVRNIPLTVIVIAPLFALFARYINISGSILAPDPELPATSRGSTSTYENTDSSPESAETQPYTADWRLLLLCVIAVLIILMQVKQQGPETGLKKALPVAAVEFIKDNKISGRMFNKYSYGGYLIYEFYPDQKVFIDGRADLYRDEFINEYRNIYYGKENWEELLEKYSIDYALVEDISPISQLLRLSSKFALIYEDDSSHVLYIRRSPEYAQIIEQYEK